METALFSHWVYSFNPGAHTVPMPQSPHGATIIHSVTFIYSIHLTSYIIQMYQISNILQINSSSV